MGVKSTMRWCAWSVVAVCAMRSACVAASEQKLGDDVQHKEVSLVIEDSVLQLDVVERPDISDEAKELLSEKEMVAWLQKHLASYPAQVHRQRGDMLLHGPLGGHDWKHLGWSATPKEMCLLAEKVIAGALEVYKTRQRVNVLSVTPNGRFLDLVVLAGLLQHEHLKGTLRRYSDCCAEKALSQEGIRFSNAARHLYPGSSIDRYGAAYNNCVLHTECANTKNTDSCKYDVLYACTGESCEKSEQTKELMSHLMRTKKAKIGILLALTKEGVVLSTMQR